MSQANTDTIRGLYEAFARGDIPAVLEALDANVEWQEAECFLYADQNPYMGPEAVLSGVFARIGGEWEDFEVRPDSFLDAGEAVIAQGHYSGVYKATGRKVLAQFAHVWTLRGGKVLTFRQYTDTKQFSEAAASSRLAESGHV
jgi:ketosteroid isomerase-like protein